MLRHLQMLVGELQRFHVAPGVAQLVQVEAAIIQGTVSVEGVQKVPMLAQAARVRLCLCVMKRQSGSDLTQRMPSSAEVQREAVVEMGRAGHLRSVT